MSKDKDILMDHFMNPRNVGELENANGIGDVGNPLCGDIIRIFLQIKNNRIEKATFKSFGCRAAIATSSILTELVKGKTVDQALKLTREDIAKVLGHLPPLKQNCAKLAEFSLKSALGDYFERVKNNSTLKQQIDDRVHDTREWRAEPAFEADEMAPL